MKGIVSQIIASTICIGELYAANYYIDAVRGEDHASGQTVSSAWRSIEPINTREFLPGDVIHLRAGDAFYGQIRPQSSGQAGAPITLKAYGEGPKPQVHGEGKFGSTILIDNISYWVIDGIEVTNTGTKPKPNRLGVHLRAQNSGTQRGIILRNLFVHDVNGSFSKDKGGGSGIMWETISKTRHSNFDGLLIEGCYLLRCDRDGIKGRRTPWTSDSPLSTNVVVRGNVLEDLGGDGIVPIGTEGALVEYNRIYGSRARVDLSTREANRFASASAGIWPWSSHNTHIRFNEVWGYEGTLDGQGYDSDFDCDGTLFEYNFSAENAGGFFLVCNHGKLEDSGHSIGNLNTTIRYNISLNDSLRGFVLGGPVRNVSIHENIIYNTVAEEFQLVLDTAWGRHVESVELRDNLFYTKGVATIYKGKWDGNGLGLMKYKAPINKETVRLSGNAYLNVDSHAEPEMKMLTEELTLLELIQQVSDDPAVQKNFEHLLNFLKDSRKWSTIEQAL